VGNSWRFLTGNTLCTACFLEPALNQHKNGGSDMDQETKDKEWQQTQLRFDRMFGKYFRDYVHMIEYKPGNVVHLLEMPLKYRAEHPETA
jgi:hypothetical protein